MCDFDDKNEKLISELKNENKKLTKIIFRLELIITIYSILIVTGACILPYVFEMEEWVASVIIFICLIPCLFAAGVGIVIEQKLGYYECGNCGHKHQPKLKEIVFAHHVGRTRYLTCPKCGQKSWNKKVITKE